MFTSDVMKNMEQKAIDIRTHLLVKYGKAFNYALKYISTEDRNSEGTISCTHYYNRTMVVSSVINQIVDS